MPRNEDLLVRPTVTRLGPCAIFAVPRRSKGVVHRVGRPLAVVHGPQVRYVVVSDLPIGKRPMVPRATCVTANEDGLFKGVRRFAGRQEKFMIFVVPVNGPKDFPVHYQGFSNFGPREFQGSLLVVRPRFCPPPMSNIEARHTPNMEGRLLVQLLFTKVPSVDLSLSRRFQDEESRGPVNHLPAKRVKDIRFPRRAQTLRVRSWEHFGMFALRQDSSLLNGGVLARERWRSRGRGAQFGVSCFRGGGSLFGCGGHVQVAKR